MYFSLFVFCMYINIYSLLTYTFSSKKLQINIVLNEMITSEFHLTLCFYLFLECCEVLTLILFHEQMISRIL